MMARSFWLVLVVLALLVPTAAAQTPYDIGFFQSIGLDTARNNCWPKPFAYADRQVTRAPFGLMVQKGWQRQNVLGEHHFSLATGGLSEAGRLKVRWIVQEVPRPHRAIYVQRADSPQETAARIDAVQNLTLQLVQNDDLPPVLETKMSTGWWPSAQVDNIGRRFAESAPEPRLPDAQADSGSN